MKKILPNDSSTIQGEKPAAKKRPGVPPKPAILPTTSAKEALELLRLQKDKGEELFRNKRLSLQDVQSWNVYTKEILTKAFGPNPEYINSIIYAAEQRPHTGYEPESILEQERRRNFEITLSMLDICMEQLDSELSKSKSIRKDESAGPGESGKSFEEPAVDEGEKDLASAIEEEITNLEITPGAESMEKSNNRKVYIINGHDQEKMKTVVHFVENLGLEPVVSHEQPGQGQNLIEDFERDSGPVFAITLLTADDYGYPKGRPEHPQPRPKQNVIFELGFLIGRLRQNLVCALYEEGLDFPAEYQGGIFIPYDAGGLWKLLVARNMKLANVDIDLNKAI
jgi:predicted nucleotide-binding protein